MPDRFPSLRYLAHKACAHPLGICWIIGTLMIWIPLSISLAQMGTFHILPDDWAVFPLLLACYGATSGLGLFIGALFSGWIVWPICRRLNGAPHKVDETVVILSGPHAGRTGCIYAIATGQGGQPLPRVDLGGKTRERFGDLFEDYQLLKVSYPSLVRSGF